MKNAVAGDLQNQDTILAVMEISIFPSFVKPAFWTTPFSN